MIGRKNWKFIAIALLAVTLVMPRAAAQDNGKELANLRGEIAKLREEVKQLKDALTQKKLEGPTFRGKSIDFWLERLNDADPQFRRDAFDAIGTLVGRNRNLIQEKKLVDRMIDLLDEGEAQSNVSSTASWVLGIIGKDAIPALTRAIEDNRPDRRSNRRAAIYAIANIRPPAKGAVPALIGALKDKDREASIAAMRALSNFGPNAKDAIPVLIEKLDQSIRERVERNAFAVSHEASIVLIALANIEPEMIDSLPQMKTERVSIGPGPRPGGGFFVPGRRAQNVGDYLMVGEDSRIATFHEAELQWRRAIDALKKRYPLSK